MSKKYQYIAGLQESTGEILISRSRHDFHASSDGLNKIDGGQDYFRQVWDSTATKPLTQVIVEYNVSPASLHNDWNYSYDKYGIIKPIQTLTGNNHVYPPGVKILWDTNEHEDRQSLSFKRKMAIWGTYGRDGKGPRVQIQLEDAETDHLEAILLTQTHINQETRAIIEDILKDRPKL